MSSDKKPLVFAIFVFALLLLLALDPSLFFIVCPALIVSGYYVWRRGEDSISRAIGLAALVIGIVIALIFALSTVTSVKSFSGARIYE